MKIMHRSRDVLFKVNQEKVRKSMGIRSDIGVKLINEDFNKRRGNDGNDSVFSWGAKMEKLPQS